MRYSLFRATNKNSDARERRDNKIFGKNSKNTWSRRRTVLTTEAPSTPMLKLYTAPLT